MLMVVILVEIILQQHQINAVALTDDILQCI